MEMENPLIVILLCNFIVFSKGGSLHLIGSPSTATEGDLFTLTCGNRSSGSRAINWYLNDSMVFTTNYETGAQNNCTFGIPGSSPYRYMAERATVSCDTHQHNVTLTINATLDSGSVWVCENNSASNVAQVTRARSVKLIINVTTRESTSTLTYESSTPTSTFVTSNTDNSRPDTQNNVYIAIGGGGASLIVCILGVMCLKRRRHSQGHSVKEDRPVINNENLNTAFQHDSSDDDIMVENDLYERSSDVISPATQDPGKADDRQVEGYTVKEGPPDIWNGNSNSSFQHDSSDDDIMVENDLYERSSDVISSATRDLGNTDGVTDGKVNKVQEKITQPDPVPATAIPDSGDDRPI